MTDRAVRTAVTEGTSVTDLTVVANGTVKIEETLVTVVTDGTLRTTVRD